MRCAYRQHYRIDCSFSRRQAVLCVKIISAKVSFLHFFNNSNNKNNNNNRTKIEVKKIDDNLKMEINIYFFETFYLYCREFIFNFFLHRIENWIALSHNGVVADRTNQYAFSICFVFFSCIQSTCLRICVFQSHSIPLIPFNGCWQSICTKQHHILCVCCTFINLYNILSVSMVFSLSFSLWRLLVWALQWTHASQTHQFINKPPFAVLLCVVFGAVFVFWLNYYRYKCWDAFTYGKWLHDVNLDCKLHYWAVFCLCCCYTEINIRIATTLFFMTINLHII